MPAFAILLTKTLSLKMINTYLMDVCELKLVFFFVVED